MAQTIDFEWDARKALSNLRKHNVTFEGATQVFLDTLAVTVYDSYHSINEERWMTLWQDLTGDLLVVAHLYLPSDLGRTLLRIISARFATRQECRTDIDC